MSDPCLVVGAGAQGLTFALELARRGKRVLVVERSRTAGGQARSYEYKGFTFDLGLHAFVSRDPALVSLTRSLLGKDFTRFYPRAASHLGNGALVEDTSRWHVRDEERQLCAIVRGTDESWNCMRIAEPLQVVYPRRGGFGALTDRMVEELRARGGKLALGVAVERSDLVARAGRLTRARVGGKPLAVSGCYWSAGTYLLGSASARRRTEGQALILFHVMARGSAPVPYHWVRLHDDPHPFVPRLVYYPKRFSEANAPRGRYSLGAVVPLPALDAVPASARPLYAWFSKDPASFLPLILERLEGAGLLRRADVLETRVEWTSLPPQRGTRAARHPFDKLENFWDADRWLADDPRESGVPLQMASALKAAGELAACV